MIDLRKISSAVNGYKQYFPAHWEDEKYKWVAVKHFQENWDIDAPNFGEMFERATAKADNLLISKNVYPAGMILSFAQADDTATREMFRMLYDESRDLTERINMFRNRAEELRQKYGNGGWKNHYQTINYISTYLWLKYPDKYYIYKYELYKKCAELFDDSYHPKANGAAENVIGGYQMYDAIRTVLSEDPEIRQIIDKVRSDACYPDPELVTATIDFGFYAARYYQSEPDNSEWFPTPEQYSPGLSVDDWYALLNDKEVFDENSLTVIRYFYEFGGQATCKEIADRFGNDPHFYSLLSIKLAKRIQRKTNCPEVPEEYSSNSKWWPILYVGKPAAKEQAGLYAWRLRDELREAYEMMIQDCPTVNAWLLAWNPTNFDWGNMTGEYSFDAMLHAVNAHGGYFEEWSCSTAKAKAGDRVYIMRLGNHIDPKGIIATGYAVSDSFTDAEGIRQIRIIITQALDYRIGEIIAQSLLKQSFPNQQWSPMGSGISIQPEATRWLIDNWPHQSERIDPSAHHTSYCKDDFLQKVFMTESQYDQLVALVQTKKNVILQGPPGVGKSFSAKRLAWSIMGEKDESRIKFVQFHQSYSYEDFIIGYRPNDRGGFDLHHGVFYQFCEKARKDPGRQYFFIIDEINRGNLSKIFGELLMLIEADKRGEDYQIDLVYGGKSFYIPENLYIIGMMNTADRSLAIIDYALRRRFSFFTIPPAFERADINGFGVYIKPIGCQKYHSVISKIKDLNDAICKDSSLGKGFEIGHSYFSPAKPSVIDDAWVQNVVRYEIIPLIEEYWFDNDTERTKWKKELCEAAGIEYDE